MATAHDVSGGSGPSDPWTIETESAEPAPERGLRWVWALVAAVVAVCVIAAGSLVAVLIALDDDGAGGAPQSGVPSAAATGAMGPLLDRVQASEQVMKDFQQSAEAATSLQGLVDAGERGRDDLTERRAALAALTLAPPDGPVASARAAYLAHVDEWIEAMDAFASGRDSANGEEIDSTFSAACDALRSAARAISDPGALDRVEDSICTDEAFDGGDDGPPGLRV